MALEGADVTSLERIGGDAGKLASMIQEHVSSISGLVNNLRWYGSDADTFHRQWSTSARALLAAAQGIEGAGKHLTSEAKQQAGASDDAGMDARGHFIPSASDGLYVSTGLAGLTLAGILRGLPGGFMEEAKFINEIESSRVMSDYNNLGTDQGLIHDGELIWKNKDLDVTDLRGWKDASFVEDHEEAFRSTLVEEVKSAVRSDHGVSGDAKDLESVAKDTKDVDAAGKDLKFMPGLGVVLGAASIVSDSYTMHQDWSHEGNWQRANQASTVAFDATSTAFAVAPNPVTFIAMGASGVAWGATEIGEHRQAIGHAFDVVGKVEVQGVEDVLKSSVVGSMTHCLSSIL